MPIHPPRWLCALALALSCTAAMAHEFWMLPDRFQVAPGGVASLSMRVGEYFTGDLVGFVPTFVVGLRRFDASGVTDLHDRLPDRASGSSSTGPLAEGTHLFAIDTSPSRIELGAEKFEAYLHDEGLDAVIAARAAAGTSAAPARERFRRNIKTLVQSGAKVDDTWSRITGQRMELVPRTNPLLLVQGQDIAFDVLFDGRPLAGALMKLWHKHGNQLVLVRAKTDAQGRVIVTPTWPGVWMASVVHMIPAEASAQDDWDSYWGNITFAVRPAAAPSASSSGQPQAVSSAPRR